jgi:hypothetical protein
MELNATYLFELSKESKQEFLLPCSESFWTTVFSLFLLQHGEQIGSLQVWRYQRRKEPPFFTHLEDLTFEVGKLQASQVAVEPSSASHMNHFRKLVNDDSEEIATWSGFSPDLVVRRLLDNGRFKYSFVEVKTGSILAANQIDNYPKLISQLDRLCIPCEFLFLCSVGGRALDLSVLSFQQLPELAGKFGVLLWEEVFLKMADVDFQPFGNKIDWRKYAEGSFRSHCQLSKAGAAG